MRADLRALGWLLLAWAVNAAAFWISVKVVGGSAFLNDIPHEVPPFIQIGYERVEVSRFVYEFSYWHGASVFLSAAWLILITCLVAVPHAHTWLASRRGSRRGRPREDLCRSSG